MTQAEVLTKKPDPCELEIDLFCKGIKIDESCTLESDARLFARTRAGLGTGLELIVPGDLKVYLAKRRSRKILSRRHRIILRKKPTDILCTTAGAGSISG